jgi:N-acyl-D-amino-acid deacylase
MIMPESSFLIRNATLIDGSGAPARHADVAVAHGRILAIGNGLGCSGGTVLDADGLVLAPGFIDIHGHSDLTLFRHPLMESKAFQGVTTEVIGNCGLGLFPVRPGGEAELTAYLQLHDYALPDDGITWHDLAGYAARVARDGLGINVAPLVGHASLRAAVMGMADRPPSPAELAAMAELLETALHQGAWGMSTGLIYPPGSYAQTEELLVLARLLARHNSLYTSHIRSESDAIDAALDEALAIASESGVRLQVSHLKAMGSTNRGRGVELLAKLAAARAAGLDVAADQYPYNASATTLTAVVPQWAHAGGAAALLGRLADPELSAGLEVEIDREIARREGAAGIMATGCMSNPHLSGLAVAVIAEGWGCSPAAAVIRLIGEEQGNVGAIFFSMAEEDVKTILADPLVAVGSDGHALTVADDGDQPTHPRSYGTFPRVLGRYVREERLLPLETAIRKMTGLPASRLGFSDRGLVREGYVADLVLFDPATISDTATYADPHRYATGVVHLLVGGRFVIRDGALTGERPGRVLRKDT